jgi:hypothetical protein
VKAILGLVVAVALLRLPTLAEPAWHPDEGIFTAVAMWSTHGLPLYAGIFDNSPPGIYWLYQVLIWLGALDHHVVVQLAALLVVMAATSFTYLIASRMLPRGGAVLAAVLCAIGLSLPTLDGDVLNVEVAALPFFMASLWLVLRGERPPPLRGRVGVGASDLLAGGLLAIALIIRPSFALDALAVLAVLLMSTRPVRRILPVAMGGAAVMSLAALALWRQGALQAYLQVALPSEHAYLVFANGGNLVPLAIRLLILGLLAVFAFRAFRGTDLRLLAIWLPAAVAGASLTPRELTHYVHEAMPPLTIAVAVLAVRFAQRRRALPGEPAQGWRWALVVPASALVALAGAEAVLVLPAQETALVTRTSAPRPFLHFFGFPHLPDYYGNWLAYISGRESAARYHAGFPVPIDKDLSESYLLQSTAGKNGRLLVLGDRPWLYVWSRLRPATRFVAQNSGYRMVPFADQETRAALDGRRADVVVLADASPGDWAERISPDGYQAVDNAPWPTFGILHG